MGEINMKSILDERKINVLVHFTQAANLPNIIRYGLMTRDQLEDKDIDFSYNDDLRYDECNNVKPICVSIEFPNYRMFYPLRMEDERTEWTVIVLNASIICDFDCVFCATNAASMDMFTQTLDQRRGEEAFEGLFHTPNLRNDLELPSRYPTDPQAEVLIFEGIPIEYIQEIHFQDEITLNKYAKFIPKKIKLIVSGRLFAYRNDWKYWQNGGINVN